MKYLASLRLLTNVAIAMSIPTVAQAHPGHGAGAGSEHDLAHMGLAVAALLFTLGLGFAARKLSTRRVARRARKDERAIAPSAPAPEQ